jgi:hypothetical protein
MRSIHVGSLALLLACMLAAGCGGAGSASGGRKAAGLATAAATSSEAERYSHAINLLAGDVPGMENVGREETARPLFSSALIRCAAHGTRYSPVAAVLSPRFTSGPSPPGRPIEISDVESEVAVWPPAAVAALDTPRAQTCMRPPLLRGAAGPPRRPPPPRSLRPLRRPVAWPAHHA